MSNEQTSNEGNQGNAGDGENKGTVLGDAANAADANKDVANADKPNEGDAGEAGAGEKKLAEEAKPGDKGEGGDNASAKQDGAPEKYEAFKVPEGVKLDESQIAVFNTVAKDLNLTQEQGQKLMDFQTKHSVEGDKARATAWDDTLEGWQKAAKSDKEIGGDKFDENVGLAVKALDAYGTPELREALEVLGVGNHPEFIRFMSRVGKDLAEDKIGHGQSGETGPKDPAKILFPNMN